MPSDDRTFNFTKAKIDALPIPTKAKRVRYRDARTPGLYLYVTSAGRKIFYYYGRMRGEIKPVETHIGPYPTVTIEQAQKRAKELGATVAKGENPDEKVRAFRAELTFGELFAKYLELHAKPMKRSWQEDEAQYKRQLTPWASRKCSKILPGEFAELLGRVRAKSGLYAANRLLALVRKVFNFGIKTLHLPLANPAKDFQRFPGEEERERRLNPDEMPKFFEAIKAEPNKDIRDYVLLSLTTGARKSNILAMRWDEINFEKAEWIIPMTKNGTAHRLPLTDEAIEILTARQAEVGESEYVFPGTGKTGHLATPRKGWERILARAGLDDLRPHDLRRTHGSYEVDTGASLPVVGKTLAHKSPAMTQRYSRVDVDPVRDAMGKATAKMWADAAKKPADDGDTTARK